MTEWRGRVLTAMPKTGLPLLRLGRLLPGHERLFEEAAACIRPSQPSDRDDGVTETAQAPDHPRTLLERAAESDLRQEHEHHRHSGESRNTTRCKWREAPAGGEACQELERECQGHLGSVPSKARGKMADLEAVESHQLYTCEAA